MTPKETSHLPYILMSTENHKIDSFSQLSIIWNFCTMQAKEWIECLYKVNGEKTINGTGSFQTGFPTIIIGKSSFYSNSPRNLKLYVATLYD